MEFIDLDIDEYNRLLTWFTKSFAKKNDADPEDIELCEKLRVMARERLKEIKADKK